jgi:hypothetical protein
MLIWLQVWSVWNVWLLLPLLLLLMVVMMMMMMMRQQWRLGLVGTATRDLWLAMPHVWWL